MGLIITSYIAIFHLIHNHLIIAIVVIKNNSLISRHSLLCSGYITGPGITPRGCIQLTYIKNVDMLNKNTPGIKKARPSRKHQLVIIHTSD